MPVETNLLMNLWCLLFYIYVFSRYYTPIITSNKKDDVVSWKGLGLLFFLYTMTSFINGDYFNYIRWIDLALNSPYSNVEPFYKELLTIINSNYLVFRTVVWGGALLLFIRTVQRLEIPVSLSLFVLFAIFVLLFSYARATLAMAVYFYGVSFFIAPFKNNRIVSFIIAAALVLLSRSFHSSAIVMIAITPIIFLSSNILNSKSHLFFFLLGFGTFLFLYLPHIYSSSMITEAESERLQHYSEKEAINYSFWGIIGNILEYSRFYLPLAIVGRMLFSKNGQKLHSHDRHVATIASFSMTYFYLALMLDFISLLFLALNPIENFTLFYRILYMSMIPLTIAISGAAYLHIISNKQLQFIINLGLIRALYSLLYGVYSYL